MSKSKVPNEEERKVSEKELFLKQFVKLNFNFSI